MERDARQEMEELDAMKVGNNKEVGNRAAQGGFFNPFTGESQPRIMYNQAASTSGGVRQRPKSSTATSGQAGRVNDIRKRINELERSAMDMYSQVRR